jgi:hypothetical protein
MAPGAPTGLFFVPFHRIRHQRDDDQVAKVRAGFQPPRQLEAIHARHGRDRRIPSENRA